MKPLSAKFGVTQDEMEVEEFLMIDISSFKEICYSETENWGNIWGGMWGQGKDIGDIKLYLFYT